ncbi:MAG: amidohydrolase [Candidatus Latescibacteria bacterium]|nr:amidohydrolase [bacterium]MBD3423400.1 amidohydrolase [Candidatus Latescibacterota bacterium]
MIDKKTRNKLVELRRELHACPELSWHERESSERVRGFISGFNPDDIITGIAGSGFAAVFRGETEGPTVVIRSELDALPISEINRISYRSTTAGVSHTCGHDGHMSIVAGLAPILSVTRPRKGKVVLLFQPAEETGEGAAKVLADSKFRYINPDYVFALHNLPGFSLNSVVTSDHTFASASKGMVIDLEGKTSHAAEPDRGISPALAMSEIIRELTLISESSDDYDQFILSTVVFAKLGEVALGTSPGEARVISTLRAFLDSDMEKLAESASAKVREISADSKLGLKINWIEEFPATVNDSGCSRMVAETAREKGLKVIPIDEPFRWSEDFGHFTGICPGALFGIGSGRDHASLHNPDYDFPEEIIETGINIFSAIIYRILGEGEE